VPLVLQDYKDNVALHLSHVIADPFFVSFDSIIAYNSTLFINNRDCSEQKNKNWDSED
jgi:hypothetical protein